MNIIRLAADMLHLISMIMLIVQISGSRSSLGVSLRTQELYLVVFVSRYLDIFTRFISLYNTLMKIVFIALTWYTTVLIKSTRHFDHDHEAGRGQESALFQWMYIIPPTVLLGVITAPSLWPQDVLWTFSFYVEAIAILPQLYLLITEREVQQLTTHYIAALGAYRALYLLNWVYRIFFDSKFRRSYVAIFCGIVQTALYGDFFYYYFISLKEGIRLTLPS